MTSQTRQAVYGIAVVAGIAAPWYFNIQWMMSGGSGAWDFIQANYANAPSGSITNDIVVACLVFLFWSFFEARRLQMKHWWLYLVLSMGISFAMAFPLFLLVRERALAASLSDQE